MKHRFLVWKAYPCVVTVVLKTLPESKLEEVYFFLYCDIYLVLILSQYTIFLSSASNIHK